MPQGIISRGVGAVLFGLPGLLLLVGGARLLSLGGSPYYVAAGVAMVATAILIMVRSRVAPLLYMLFCVGTMDKTLKQVPLYSLDQLCFHLPCVKLKNSGQSPRHV